MMSPSKSKTTACNVNSAPNYPEAMGSTSKDSRRWVPHAEPIASGSRVRNLLPRVGVGSGPVGEGGDEAGDGVLAGLDVDREAVGAGGSEEHTSELQSLMRISYAVFCLKKKKHTEYYDVE